MLGSGYKESLEMELSSMDIDPVQVHTREIESAYPHMWDKEVRKQKTISPIRHIPGWKKNWKTILAKLILNLLVSLSDFGSDTRVGIHLKPMHPIWSSLTFLLMFLPGFIIGVCSCLSHKFITQYLQDNQQRTKSFNFIILTFIVISTFVFPLGVLFAQCFEILILICDEENFLDDINYITNGMMGLEAFLESGPQTILQFYIMFHTKTIFLTQIFSIGISLVSIAKTAIMYDFLMYSGDLKHLDLKKMLKYLSSVLPLYLSSSYFKIGSISLICIYLKYWAFLPFSLLFAAVFMSAIVMRFSFLDSFVLGITNLTVVCVGPSMSPRLEDSRYKFILASTLLAFFVFQVCLALLAYFFNANPAFVPVTKILDPTDPKDLSILNMIVLSVILLGITNLFILLASKYSNLKSDRSAAQIFKSIDHENLEFTQMSNEDKQEQLEQAIKKRKSPALILYLLFFINMEKSRRRNVPLDRSFQSLRFKSVTINPPDPLVWAVENDNWELFDLLMERSDMDINREDSEGKTAVSAAIMNDRIDMLKVLMKRKNFNSNHPGKLGSPLGIALSHKNKDVLNVILDHESTFLSNQRSEEAIIAVYSEDIDVLTKLIRTRWVKFDIHMEIPRKIIRNRGLIEKHQGQDSGRFYLELENNFTLLSWCVWKGNILLCSILLNNNYKEEEDQDWEYLQDPLWGGWSPVTFQVLRVNVRMLTFLASHEVFLNKNQVLPNKFTPLTWAIFKGSLELLQFLLSNKDVDLEQADGWGNRPLNYAEKIDNKMMTHTLLGYSEQREINTEETPVVETVNFSARGIVDGDNQNQETEIAPCGVKEIWV